MATATNTEMSGIETLDVKLTWEVTDIGGAEPNLDFNLPSGFEILGNAFQAKVSLTVEGTGWVITELPSLRENVRLKARLDPNPGGTGKTPLTVYGTIVSWVAKP